MIRFEAESIKTEKVDGNKRKGKNSFRVDILSEIKKDFEVQSALLDVIVGKRGYVRPGKVLEKENVLRALIHKTEVNLELLKLA